MANWTYRCYIDGTKLGLWHQWYNDNVQAQGAHDLAFEFLEQLEVWKPPNFKHLSGPAKGLHQVKFKGRDNRQWRVIGHANQQNQVFVALAIGYKKGKSYTPSNLLEKAKQRLQEVEADDANAENCERPGR